nr:MAG TPA: hypothetical protein [Caudoviricetes sp.]
MAQRTQDELALGCCAGVSLRHKARKAPDPKGRAGPASRGSHNRTASLQALDSDKT